MRASYIAYRKVGNHRNGKRIWLQGNSLDDAGFSIGDEFETKVEPGKIILTISDSGERKVARKKITGKDEYRPIVDLSNQVIADFFKHFDRCKISFFSHGVIIITYHPTDKKITERLNKFYQAISSRLIKTGSLCHGGGIMSSALHQGVVHSGFDTELQFAIELEQKYLESSLNNSPIWSGNSMAIEGLMEDIELQLLDEVVLFEAGLPCTGASISGRSKNKLKFAEQHESAGRLFFSFLSMIQKTSPVFVILENVKQYMNTISFHVIQDVLKGWGYECEVKILNGLDFGALENRERMFMIAVSKGIKFNWENVYKHIPDKPFQCIGDLLDPVSDNDSMWSEMKGLKRKQVSDIEKGKGFMMQAVDASSTKSAVIGKGYSKIRSTEPKIAHPSNPELLLRQFTVNEHCRVKTIPEYLVKGNKNTTAHEILGQSIIYNIVKSIGHAIGDCLLSYEDMALKTA